MLLFLGESSWLWDSDSELSEKVEFCGGIFLGILIGFSWGFICGLGIGIGYSICSELLEFWKDKFFPNVKILLLLLFKFKGTVGSILFINALEFFKSPKESALFLILIR